MGYRSDTVNTDALGLRYSHWAGKRYSPAERGSTARVNLLVGGSTAFGIGASGDDATVASHLSALTGEVWLSLAGCGLSATQELLLFLTHQHRLGKIGHVVIRRAQAMLREMRAMAAEVRALQDGFGGTVRVGAVTGPAVGYLVPAIRQGGESKSITTLLFLSTVAIGLFYGAGLMWGEHTHLSMVEYWRWWVVHLWVEGFFEVFATAVIAFLFTKLGLIKVSTGTLATLFATIVFMAGGVLGTLHHLYFTGTPTAVIALGASFSALEVVPLAYVGFEAYHTYKLGKATPWMQRYKWPILFFVAVAFWNLVGAGLFGFLINPPLPLYYMQGLNLTPLHGHTALFGVYGMLGIGLMLFCLRGLKPESLWSESLLRSSFWTFNIGLSLMALLTLLPLGVLQQIRDILKNARDGDFSARITKVPNMGEVGQVAWEVNEMFDQLETYFREVGTTFARVEQERFGRPAQSDGMCGGFHQSLIDINKAIEHVEQNYRNVVKNRLLSSMQSMNAVNTKGNLHMTQQDLSQITEISGWTTVKISSFLFDLTGRRTSKGAEKTSHGWFSRC